MSLEICRHSSAGTFCESAAPFLYEREAEHSLILGVADQMAAKPGDPEHDWLTVSDAGRVVGAVMRTPPHIPVLSHMPNEAVAALVRNYAERGISLSGVFGPSVESEYFARLWSERTAGIAAIRWRMPLSVCQACREDERSTLDAAAAVIRPAVPADRECLASFLVEFHRDVEMELPPEPLAVVDRILAVGTMRVCDVSGRVTSCANLGRESRHSATVTLVYTPPEDRGRGYATACVGSLTREQLARGKSFCCLYTNAAAPIPNHIYSKLGYQPVEEFLSWRFETVSKR